LEIEDKAEKTIEGYKQAFKTLSEVYSGGYSIHKVNRTAIWQIKAYLKNKGNRPATINSYLKRLRAAFKRLYLDDVIDKNPFQEFEPLYEPKDKQNIYTFDELKRLLQILNSDKNRKLCRLMRISLFTGIRRGEVLNIERIDVNLGERFYRAINNKSKDKHKVWR